MSELLTEVDGDVWRITLDRPEQGNSLTPALARELAAAFSDRPAETRARSSVSSRTTGTRSSGCCSTPPSPSSRASTGRSPAPPWA
jgi:1,4-dihydroxy-2-naphthoyl-CoA synthase